MLCHNKYSVTVKYGLKMQINNEQFGIIGYGYVGKATHISFLKDKECVIHDHLLGTDIEILRNISTLFVCIPTVTDNDIDLMIAEIKKIKEINQMFDVVVRSTLPLDSCKRIQDAIGEKIIYIPEFLRERFWNTDCLKRPLIVGTEKEHLPEWLKKQDHIQCSLSEAELIKMFSNNFASVRIAFANVFYDLAQKVGADYDLIKEMFFKVQHDQTYMDVPGHDGGRGFSGKCLPKDLDFLIDTLDAKGINQNWFKHIRELNNEWIKDSE
jgi:UDPglucose 6-dehydrogenase